MKKVVSILFLLAFVITGFGAANDFTLRRVNPGGTGFLDQIYTQPASNVVSTTIYTNGIPRATILSDGLFAEDISGQWYLYVDGAELIASQPGVFATPADLSNYALTTYVDSGLSSKADSSHTHAISDVTSLQSALDGKSPTSHNHDSTYATISHNHDATYAALSHTHTTNDLSQVNAHLANIVSLIPPQRKSFATNVTTSAGGTYTWTFPSAFNGTPVVTVTVFDSAAGVFYNERVTARSTTSATISVSQSTSVTILGIGVLTLPTTAATSVSIRAEEQH